MTQAKTKERTKAPHLPIGTVVQIQTNGLVAWLDLYTGRVVGYDPQKAGPDHVQVRLDQAIHHCGEMVCRVWLWDFEIMEVKP